MISYWYGLALGFVLGPLTAITLHTLVARFKKRGELAAPDLADRAPPAVPVEAPPADPVESLPSPVKLDRHPFGFKYTDTTGRLAFNCPKCSMLWFFKQGGSPKFCTCSSGDDGDVIRGHFHMRCGAKDAPGCGYCWIMLERPASNT